MQAGPDDQRLLLRERVATARAQTAANARRLAETRARLATAHEQMLARRSQRQVLHDSAYARLVARLESMPVIEQAKGIRKSSPASGRPGRSGQRAGVSASRGPLGEESSRTRPPPAAVPA